MKKYNVVFIFCITQVILCCKVVTPAGSEKVSISKTITNTFTSKYPELDTFGNLTNLYLIDGKDSIFRSKQPDENDFRELYKRYKIKSILKLDGEKKDEYGNLSFDSCDIAMHFDTVLPAQLDIEVIRALKFLKTAKKPVLVHCSAGVDRTGLIIALYEVLYLNKNLEDARNERKNTIGFQNKWPILLGYLNETKIEYLKKVPGLEP